MPSTIEDLRAQSRAYATSEERQILALETIADQLRLLVALVTPAEGSEGGGESAVVTGSNTPAEGAWENEGGSLDTGSAVSLGLKRSTTDQFETGGYRYTKITDAIAEACRSVRKRMGR